MRVRLGANPHDNHGNNLVTVVALVVWLRRKFLPDNAVAVPSYVDSLIARPIVTERVTEVRRPHKIDVQEAIDVAMRPNISPLDLLQILKRFVG